MGRTLKAPSPAAGIPDRPVEHVPVTDIRAAAYRIPTEKPETDGTLKWDATVLVVVEADAGGRTGWGYTYAEAGAAGLARGLLRDHVLGRGALDVEDAWRGMIAALRNFGVTGLCSMAVSAVDNALWDLKARLLDLPLADLLGKARPSIPVYGSGGFTSYDVDELKSRMGAWIVSGLTMAKMKVGSHPDRDAERVRAARRAMGPDAGLFVDANGAYTVKQALEMAEAFAESGVSWFEEPVPASDLPGTREVRRRAPPGMEVAGGEYGFALGDFVALLNGVVDVLQADATRCLGITGFLKAAAMAEAHNIPLSSHCAPSLHLPLGCALGPMRHLEFFHDHVLIERRCFDGFREPVSGSVYPDRSRPGFGLDFRRADAEKYRIL
jgi:L-alanine-DL-glutamate epimerase-like enolase superfamily enzyme